MIEIRGIVAVFCMILPFGNDIFACAGCRNPNMPSTRSEASTLRVGELQLGTTFGITMVDVVHESGCLDVTNCNETFQQPLYLHDQRLIPAQLSIQGDMAVNKILSFGLRIPARMVGSSIDYTTPEGNPYQPLDEGIHHRNEIVTGLGDIESVMHLRGELKGYLLSGRFGFSLPTGKTEPNPFELGEQGKSHQHIQFGNGTFDPLIGIDVSKFVGLWIFIAYLEGKTSLYENKQGFQAGSRVSTGLQSGRQVRGSLSATLGLEWSQEEPERWNGKILSEGNLGRSELLSLLSLRKSFEKSDLSGSIHIPLYRDIVTTEDSEGSFSSPITVSLGWYRKFFLW